MKDASSKAISKNLRAKSDHRVTGWLLFPLALFPLIALLTYDPNAISWIRTPPAPSANWIGLAGDYFAFAGYIVFGLAIWAVPALCVLWGLCKILGRKIGLGRRWWWFTVVLVCASCLVQVGQTHAPGIAALLERINTSNAGGLLGYFFMTLLLVPLLSDFGASLLVLVTMAVALVGAIGLHNLASFFVALWRWATLGKYYRIAAEEAVADAEEGEEDAARDIAYENALKAREEAKRQREAEKARAKAEREAERERIKAAKDAARKAREAEAELPLPASVPAKRPHPDATRDNGTGTEETEEPKEKRPYMLPPATLLDPLRKSEADHGNVAATGQRLVDTLKLFNIDAEIKDTKQGPVVTKYVIQVAPGTRYSAVTAIADNIKGAMHAKSLRIEAPIPGEEYIGIEVPNLKPAGISFREIFESDVWQSSKAELPLLFGKQADGKVLVSDLASMPHMLVAGATGQGKSVCLNSIINGLLMTRTPEQMKLIMVDPKSVEFTWYASIPHLLVPVITDNRKVVFSLHWAVAEMEKRLKMFARAKVKNIYDFNHRKTFVQPSMFGDDDQTAGDMPKTVPYIVIIIDEVADLMMAAAKEVTPDISRLTAKARAAGIHLILATQRPDAKIITGTIKANIPGRVAFKTATSIDSRTILDDTGAENLIGRGDMLFKSKEGMLIRAQGAWISDPEIERITKFIEEHADVQFDEKFASKLGKVKEAGIEDPFAGNEDDPDNQPQPDAGEKAAQRQMVKAAADADDFKKAVECVINTQRASTSHFQRQLGWGYNHAAKILDMLTERGIVSAPQGMGPRQIIMDQNQLVAILNGGSSGESPESAGEADAGEAGDFSFDEGQSTPQEEF
ncbi:MAG: DNA translocase FtsK 4TM domain-containing protein [Kiritimatiellae bacterium]|nr:DNA translocase FtsK 4TM domain-containing protein [Kiritimatiellia bacterium]